MRLILLLLAIASPAHAADFFTPVAGDLSLTMLLQPVFGSLFGGSGDGPLGEAIKLFNVCCLTIGGLLTAYTLVFGTMQTAHDGEMLGKKWSSMWVPIRLVIGTAAVVPVGSYCVAQMLVAWLAMQGVGMADAVWTAFANSAFASQSIASASAPTPNVSKLGFGMLRSQVCMRGFQKLASEGEGIGAIFAGMPTTTGDMNTVRRYGMPGLSATQCGGVVGSDASGGVMAKTAGFFGINTGAAEKAAAIRQAHAGAAMVLEGEMASLAGDIVNGNTSGAESRYIAAVMQYQKSLGEAAKAQMGDQAYFSELARNASNDGWLLAGSFFMRLVALEDALMKALADSPTAMPVEAAPAAMGSDMERYYHAMAGAVRDASLTGIDNQLLADKAREDSESGIVMSAINAVFNKINDGTTAGFQFLTESDADRHPMLVASSAGHTMINWALALAVASIAVAHIGGFTVSMVLGAFVISLLGAGGMLAYFLPMLPFIIWVSAIAGWFLSVIEGVLGAPLWAVKHLDPRGEELQGGAGAGYMLVLELTLKPVLMVFGFCFAVLVSMPLGQFINRVFYSTFQLNQGGFAGFVGLISSVAIFSGLHLTLLKYTFGAIQKIPDQLMKWIGGGHGSGLAEAGNTGAAVEHQSGAAVGAVTGAVAGAATSKLNTMSHRGGKADVTAPGVRADSADDASPHAPTGTRMAEQFLNQKETQDREVEAQVDQTFNAKDGSERSH